MQIKKNLFRKNDQTWKTDLLNVDRDLSFNPFMFNVAYM